nr:acyl-CoA dehydrogenase family protein [Bradyrhizobium diazoefficiens]
MDFALTDQQETIRDAIVKICSRFDDAYWLDKDRNGGFPHDFHKALADDGWLGICVPEGLRRIRSWHYGSRHYDEDNLRVWRRHVGRLRRAH